MDQVLKAREVIAVMVLKTLCPEGRVQRQNVFYYFEPELFKLDLSKIRGLDRSVSGSELKLELNEIAVDG